MPESRAWDAFGNVCVVDDEERFLGINVDLRGAQMQGPSSEVLRLRLVEDEGGTYRGWLPADGGALRMIQRDRLFAMQFMHGPGVEVAAGHGEVVYLRVDRAGAAE